LRGVVALRDQHGRPGPPADEIRDCLAVDQVAPVEDEEMAGDLRPRLEDAVCGPELLVLHRVLDSGAERLPLLEVAHDPLAAVPDDQADVVDPLVDERPDDVLEDRAVPDGDHHLRLGGGEGPHPGSFPRRENRCLHSARSAICVRPRCGPGFKYPLRRLSGAKTVACPVQTSRGLDSMPGPYGLCHYKYHYNSSGTITKILIA